MGGALRVRGDGIINGEHQLEEFCWGETLGLSIPCSLGPRTGQGVRDGEREIKVPPGPLGMKPSQGVEGPRLAFFHSKCPLTKLACKLNKISPFTLTRFSSGRTEAKLWMGLM